MYLLAHDLGTSGNKATLYDTDGKLVAACTSAYDTRFFNGNWAEQDPEDWWRAICESTKALLATAKVAANDIRVVALSGQMMGCTPVNKQGRALRPSILYCDQRATVEADAILQRISLKDFYAIVGHRISPSYTLEKMMWIRDHEPQIYAQMHKTLCAKDYINFRLTGRMATDFSDASGTNAFDLNTWKWSSKIIDLAGVDGAMFPEAMPSSAVLGEMTAEAAAATGLASGTPVAVGGGDGSCAGVGVGCVRPGTAYNCLGSSSWIALTVEKPIVDVGMRTMNWAHCVPGYLHPSGTMQTAGTSHRWMKDVLCDVEAAAGAARNVDPYLLIEEAVQRSPVGANGVMFLPYLLGERTPWWNPNARGAFLGLGLATKREDMLRAVLEGITLNLGIIVDIFRQHVAMDKITVVGGGARSPVWRQMMADVYGCPVESLNFLEEATSMGAAVIGGVAVGIFPSFDVLDRFVAVTHVHKPDPVAQRHYRALAPIFIKAYKGLVEVHDDLASLLSRPS